ncbi:lymphoid enhancer-binding factor 1 isoform X3 [Tachysurus ichikawai]
MPQLAGGGGGGDPELCATDEMIPFKDEGDPQKEQNFAEITNSEEEGDLAELKSSLVNESETSPNSNSHDAVRQSQITPDSYHEKHREHPDDGKLQDLYSKGHAYSGYPSYIMMTNMNSEPYMNNGSLSPPMPRTLLCKSSVPAKKRCRTCMQAAVHSNPVWRFLYGEQSRSGPVSGTGTRRRLTYELISGIVHPAPACVC